MLIDLIYFLFYAIPIVLPFIFPLVTIVISSYTMIKERLNEKDAEKPYYGIYDLILFGFNLSLIYIFLHNFQLILIIYAIILSIFVLFIPILITILRK